MTYATIPTYKVNRIYKTSHPGYAKLISQDFYVANMEDTIDGTFFTVPIADLRMMDITRELIKQHPTDAYDMKKLIEQWNEETDGDWLPVLQCDVDPDPVNRSNFDTALLLLQGVAKDDVTEYWIYTTSRWLFANMSNYYMLDAVEDLYSALDFHGDLDEELSHKYQVEFDIANVLNNPPSQIAKHKPDDWAEQVYYWIERYHDRFDFNRIGEACFSLGFMTQIICPKGHVRYQSNTDDHWSENLTINKSKAAAARYYEWLQQESGAMLTHTLPGFPSTHVPYPENLDEDFNNVVDLVDGFYICPHCGTKMKETT